MLRDGRHILVDPFLDENPGSPVKHDQLERVDLVVVSHAAFDHLGDTDKIAKRHGCPVICGGEVKAWLMARGVPAEQIRATTWGIRVEVAGIEVQPVECHHWSQIKMPDGTFASGVPMAFVIHADEGVRFYHYGDTAIFSHRVHTVIEAGGETGASEERETIVFTRTPDGLRAVHEHLSPVPAPVDPVAPFPTAAG